MRRTLGCMVLRADPKAIIEGGPSGARRAFTVHAAGVAQRRARGLRIGDGGRGAARPSSKAGSPGSNWLNRWC